MKTEWILITGASSGIGAATAVSFARKGHSLILIARRKEKLEAVAKQCLSVGAFRVQTLVGDVTSDSTIQACEEFLTSQGVLATVVLNAGFAYGREPFQNSNPVRLSGVLETNANAVFRWSHWVANRFLDQKKSGELLRDHSSGNLVVLGSVAGHWSYACGHVYAASKAAVASFVQGLRRDLDGTGIRVMEIAPGMVETEFSLVRFDGDTAKANAVYAGKTPLVAEDIAEMICWVVAQPARVNVQSLIVFPTFQAGV